MAGSRSFVDVEPGQGKAMRQNWLIVSFCFGTMSSVAVLLLAYSTSLLEGDTGYYGSSLLYVMWMFSSTFVVPQFLPTMGSKKALLFGSFCYNFYYICFLLKFWLRGDNFIGTLGTGIVYLGYGVSGLGAGFLWTAQGVYFSQTVKMIAADEQVEPSSINQGLASIFAALNLFPEVGFKLLVSWLQQYDWIPQYVPILTACLIAVGVTVFMAVSVVDLYDPNQKTTSGGEKCKAMVTVWQDPCLWLLAFTNLTFGFAGAFLNGKISGAYTKPQLGLSSIGRLSAAISLIAAVCQFIFPTLVTYLGKGAVLGLGSLSFLVYPIVILPLSTDQLHNLGYGLVAFYVAQGLGRAAYESTNRAIFVDFFPPPSAEPAFATVSIQQSLAFAGSYFLGPLLSEKQLVVIVGVLAVGMVPGFFAAHALRKARPISDPLQPPSEVET